VSVASPGTHQKAIEAAQTPPSRAVPAVELVGLTKEYGAVTAVDSVDLSVQPGELISILGASGSGKTTMLRLLAGFETPTRGEIRLHGQSVARLSPAERQVGMVFQNYALFPHLSVRANIAYGLKMRGWKKRARDERVGEMLTRMQLDMLGDRLPRQISGGQQQRVAIARALAYSPRLLLMDEPLGALDKALKQDLLREIRRVHHEFETTIMYVTHDREEALTLSDRVAIMDEGELVTCLPVDELYLRPPNGFVARFFSGANALELTESVVTVTGRSDTGVAVSVGSRSAEIRLDDPAVLAVPDEGLSLVFRPIALRLAPGNADDFVFEGQVIDVVFLGDQVNLEVELDGSGTHLACSVDRHQAQGVATGDRVCVYVSPADCRIVPTSSSAGSAPAQPREGNLE
jgi:ABC-type Fe3+/spermidine/putrescine transport system ATPase subunit